MCAEHGKIVFSGQGLDELFFGYIRDLATYVWSAHGPQSLIAGNAPFERLPKTTQQFLDGWEGFLRSMTSGPDPAFALFRKLCRLDPFAAPAANGRAKFLTELQGAALRTYGEMHAAAPGVHEFMLAAETEIQLPALLHMEDRASMRYSVESRVPFCNSSMLDVARSVDLKWKFVNGEPKGLLRHAFGDLLPRHILDRKQKVGRPIPLSHWLDQPVGAPYKRHMENARDLLRDLTSTDLVEWATTTTNPYDRMKWAVLSLARWIDVYGVAV
jgi:asparagine synthase (glutamine-hydrolysing)